MLWIETSLSLCVGIGLAAACGFRVFLPCLAAGVGQRLGLAPLAALPDGLSSTPALCVLGAATFAEIGAYYLPWVDNMLDSVASPAALIAGALLFAGVTPELPPPMRWALAIIAGGAAAGVTQTATVLGRAASLGTTGGIANPIISTLEAILATVTTLAAVLIPPLAVVLLIGFSVWALVAWRRRANTSGRTDTAQSGAQ